MICFLAFFIYTVLTFFALYRLIVHFQFSELFFIMHNCYWNTVFAFQIILIIKISHGIMSEGQSTGFIVHELLNLNKLDERTENSLNNFSLQIRHLVPNVTCKAFTFDWTLIYAVSF